jgi:hypothetical protein
MGLEIRTITVVDSNGATKQRSMFISQALALRIGFIHTVGYMRIGDCTNGKRLRNHTAKHAITRLNCKTHDHRERFRQHPVCALGHSGISPLCGPSAMWQKKNFEMVSG